MVRLISPGVRKTGQVDAQLMARVARVDSIPIGPASLHRSSSSPEQGTVCAAADFSFRCVRLINVATSAGYWSITTSKR